MSSSTTRNRASGTGQYAQLATTPAGATPTYTAKKPRKPLIDRLADRAMALLWVVAAAAIVIYTDLIAIYDHPELNHTASILALVSFGLATATFLYLSIYVPRVHKTTVDYAQWQRTAPNAIPFATACGLSGFFCSAVAMWPIFGLLALPMIFVLFMGFIVVVSIF
ncbi:hypothetical protein GGF32_003410 [Allomyces javanicus]|nr:hypothetical protein GGF32_003410 [Allomyces javanicus]